MSNSKKQYHKAVGEEDRRDAGPTTLNYLLHRCQFSFDENTTILWN
jgi:hypothetical protein